MKMTQQTKSKVLMKIELSPLQKEEWILIVQDIVKRYANKFIPKRLMCRKLYVEIYKNSVRTIINGKIMRENEMKKVVCEKAYESICKHFYDTWDKIIMLHSANVKRNSLWELFRSHEMKFCLWKKNFATLTFAFNDWNNRMWLKMKQFCKKKE